MEREIRYCTTRDGVSIAYAVSGAGPPLVHVPPGPSHLQLAWSQPWNRARYEWLGRRHTVISYDLRGCGLSQREGFEHDYPLDLEAVVDALALERVSLFATAAAAKHAVAYAATYPERVDRIVLWNGIAGNVAAVSPSVAALVSLAESDWTLFTETYASVLGGWESHEEARQSATAMRASITPEEWKAQLAWFRAYDVMPLLPRVKAPTLVVHLRESLVPIEAVRPLAAGIPNARFQSVDGKSVFMSLDSPQIAPWLEAFLSGDEPVSETPGDGRAPAREVSLRTVLFTDIVGHTEMMQRLGDAKGRDVLREHERITRETLKAHGGAEVKTMGDGFLASFGSVTRALDCAIALQRAFDGALTLTTASRPAFGQPSPTGGEGPGERVSVRIGLNAGEPIEEEGDLFGSTVILASRVCAQAGAGEILIPEPLRHLLSGKSYVYGDRGEVTLKGFDDAMRLYEVRWRE